LVMVEVGRSLKTGRTRHFCDAASSKITAGIVAEGGVLTKVGFQKSLMGDGIDHVEAGM
jgi:hypothetical protein